MILKKCGVIAAENDGWLQLAVALVLVIFCGKTLWRMIAGVGAMVRGAFDGTFRWRKANRYQMTAVYLLVTVLPLLLLLFIRKHYDFAAQWGDNLLFVGAMMLANAGLLYIGTHSICHDWTVQDMKVGHALKLGLFQAVTALPGLSRLGVTVSMGRNMGFEKETALDFAMVMSIPALLIDGFTSLNAPVGGALPFAGALVAAALGAAAALFLLKWLMKRDAFGIFALYSAAAGLLAVVLNFVL